MTAPEPLRDAQADVDLRAVRVVLDNAAHDHARNPGALDVIRRIRNVLPDVQEVAGHGQP